MFRKILRRSQDIFFLYPSFLEWFINTFSKKNGDVSTYWRYVCGFHLILGPFSPLDLGGCRNFLLLRRVDEAMECLPLALRWLMGPVYIWDTGFPVFDFVCCVLEQFRELVFPVLEGSLLSGRTDPGTEARTISATRESKPPICVCHFICRICSLRDHVHFHHGWNCEPWMERTWRTAHRQKAGKYHMEIALGFYTDVDVRNS